MNTPAPANYEPSDEPTLVGVFKYNICALLGVDPYEPFVYQAGNDTSLSVYRVNGMGLMDAWDPDTGWKPNFGTMNLCKVINGQARIVKQVVPE